MTLIVHPLLIAAVVVVFVGLVLQIVATATVGWLEISTSNVMYGLWSYCPQISVCNSYGTEVKNILPAIQACEAFSILSILSASATIVMCIGHVVQEATKDITRRLYITIAFWVNFFSAVCSLICIFVWRFKVGEELGGYLRYSYFLCVAGLVCFAVSSLLFRIYIRRLVRGSYQVMP
ncbi:hypothetical protein BgiBS90_023015 [Biomphalaria glabrata]|uniref:Uncharacterized protein n=1 Tax=Biomphalaria glabrata TaxID=6526 RepID=A0A2C9KVC6_BIOGL|nr:hypothetical protein BgiBS90_023015 [Biomphalaria glabrata]